MTQLRQVISIAVAAASLVSASMAGGQRVESDEDLAAVLQRVGERVDRYFARAQSIVCLETVIWQPLDMGLTVEGLSRQIESELSLAWDASDSGRFAPEIKIRRRLLKVNGRPPRRRDPHNCTSAEQTETETAPLSMLLPGRRDKYRFRLAGVRKVKGRDALLVDFVENARPKVESSLVDDNEDCISYSIDGGHRGRIWVDADSYDVLRLEQRVAGMLDIPMPRKVAQRYGQSSSWTLERSDSTLQFEPIVFRDPDEVLVLPVSMIEMHVTRGAGVPRLRTTTEYTNCRRFLTGGRIVR